MTKREMIDDILSINISAEPRFLARFADDQLFEYLTHLRVLSKPRLTGSADRYDKYFRDLPKVAARSQWRTDAEHAEEICVDDMDQADPGDDYDLEEEAVEEDAVEGGQDGELFAEASYGQELVVQDVDLAVGADEREQLLSVHYDLDDQDADGQEPDEGEMEAPFKIAATPPKAAKPRARASTPAKLTPYSTDSTQAPAGRSASRAKSHAHAAAPPPIPAPEAEQDKEAWLY